MKAATPVLLTLSLLIALPSRTAIAQTDAGTDATYEALVDVLEVQVPVHVVGKDGEPVRDFSPDSFEILDNGRRQEVRSVESVDLTLIEPGMTRSEIERSVPAAARRRFLLLFDLSFSRASTVLKAREAARRFVLESLHPTDLVAVAKLTAESGAQLVVTFSPDRAQLARAIDTLGAPELLSAGRRSDPLRFLIDEPSGESGFASQPGSATSRDHFQSSNSAVQSYLDVISKQMDRMEKGFDQGRVQAWSRSMEHLARAMASVRGRKHIIYFSEGFDGSLILGERNPEVVADQSLTSIQQSTAGLLDTDDVYGNTQLQGTVQRMLEEFEKADAVIETVDISGLAGGAAGRDAGSRSRRDALFYVANQTGGKLYEGSNELGAQMEELLESSSVTWVLTFQPRDIAADGSFHKLKVKADLPKGARLSYRTGYFAPRPYTDLHPFEKSLLAADAVAGVTPRSDLELDLVAAPFRAGGESSYVPLILEISGTSLLAGHPDEQLPIELYAYVSNDRGEMRDFFTRAVTIDLAGREDLFRRSGLKYYGHFDLDRAGEFLVRVVVRNAATGRTGVETVAVVVPEGDHPGPIVLPPFFMEETPTWFMVREEIADGEGSVIYPFTVNGQPYVPAARPSLRRGDRARLCVVAYDLAEGPLEVEGTVTTGSDAETVTVPVELVERTITGLAGVDKLLLAFDTADLEAGEHHFGLRLAGDRTGSAESGGVPFIVVD